MEMAVPGELLFRATTWHVALLCPGPPGLARLYVHPLNGADFKGIRAG
jgi:hypothetical protein